MQDLTNFPSSVRSLLSTPSTFLNANNAPLNKTISTPHHKNNGTMSLSSEELQEVRNMNRKLRQLKRQMFLKQVEAPSPVDSFRSLIIGLAVEQEAKEAFRSRSNSFLSEGTSTRSTRCSTYVENAASSFNDSFCSSVGDLHQIEE